MRLIGYVGAGLVLPAAAVLSFGVLSWLFPQPSAPPLGRTQPQAAAATAAVGAAPPAARETARYTSEGAQGACVLSIPPQMHDPGSVDFIGLTSSWPVQAAGPANTWDVLVPLRARNPLGALVRQTVRCTVRREAGGWRLVWLAAE